MKRHEFFNMTRVIDKFFNTSSNQAADGELSKADVDFLASQAQEQARRVFPKIAGTIHVTGVIDADAEFAGYRVTVGDANGGYAHDETFEFDFGSEGIDVTE